MADREILDALLRLEAQNREDHLSLQGQIRGFAGRTIKLESDVVALAERMEERQKGCIRRHKRLDRASWAILAGVGTTALAVVGRFMGLI